MDQLTTRERAAAILSGAKLRMLESERMTVISAEEWYETQAALLAMRKALEHAEWLGDREYPCCPICEAQAPSYYSDGEPHRDDCMLHRALQSDAGNAFAERVQALEKFYTATTKRDALLSQKNPHYETLDFVKDQAWWQEMAELISQAEGAVAEAVDELEAIDRG